MKDFLFSYRAERGSFNKKKISQIPRLTWPTLKHWSKENR